MRAKNTLALAALSGLLLAACSATDTGSTAMSRSGENYSGSAGAGPGATQAGMASNPGSDSAGGMNTATSATASGGDMRMDGSQPGASIASATVQSIEPVARGMDRGSGETQAGSAGNMMYRVTLRLDDGSTRAIMQPSQPTYQIGERVKMVNGLLQRY